MFLQKLELQGFKSFAPKTTVEFLSPTPPISVKGGSILGEKEITAIVGPNGSGKSNVADGIRWVLGEQSMKLLRGKKSEDVIFSGTDKRSRSGFAEVSLFLNNEDGKALIDYREVAITRRLYRDGESEYLINKSKCRLLDIQLLLAKASLGQRTYSVIGQGMIDSLLTLSPEERKGFFDEAAGVRPHQIKKEQALAKLEETKENLKQVGVLVAEITPRLRSLARQAKRLDDRAVTEGELHGLEHIYYGGLWKELKEKIAATESELRKAEEELLVRRNELKTIQGLFAKLEKQKPANDEVRKLQDEYQKFLDQREGLREREIELRVAVESLKVRAAGSAPPMPLADIIGELEVIVAVHETLLAKLSSISSLDELKTVKEEIKKASERAGDLVSNLKGTGKRHPKESAELNEFLKKLDEVTREFQDLGGRITAIRARMEKASAIKEDNHDEFFALQRKSEAKQAEILVLERKVSDIRVEMARLETRREGLEAEMAAALKERVGRVKTEAAQNVEMDPAEVFPQIQKLRYQLELIGGIDPEVAKEYSETKTRHEFLTSQSDDLAKAMDDLNRGIEELEQMIEAQFKIAFNRINEDFGRYFQILFNGGAAKLVKMEVEEEAAEPEEQIEEKQASEEEKKREVRKKTIVEIQATPPGKRVKSLQVLSGGERALTAIALICAILSNNPSPFVVLDEVDAALDEFNSARFAAILKELSHKTQFIVITHNRATMEAARILYGVTMGDDGVSRLLSVKLEEAAKNA